MYRLDVSSSLTIKVFTAGILKRTTRFRQISYGYNILLLFTYYQSGMLLRIFPVDHLRSLSASTCLEVVCFEIRIFYSHLENDRGLRAQAGSTLREEPLCERGLSDLITVLQI